MAESTEQSDPVEETLQETQTGLDENIAAALAYVLGFLTGIILFFVETENEHVRFHAAQSIVVFGGLFVVSIALSFFQAAFGFGNVAGFFLGAIFGLLSLIISIVGFLLWVYLMVRTYQGKDPRIPGAAGIAEGFV